MESQRHYCVVDSYNRKLTITHEGTTVVSTTNAKVLKEVGKSVYDSVFYIPKEDLLIELFPELGRNSHCPIKGDASYWVIKDKQLENYFAWSYEEALPMAKKVEGHVAFNPHYISFTSEPIYDPQI